MSAVCRKLRVIVWWISRWKIGRSATKSRPRPSSSCASGIAAKTAASSRRVAAMAQAAWLAGWRVGHSRPAAVPGVHAFELKLARRARCRRSEEHTSELQSLMRISYADFCLKKKKITTKTRKKQRILQKKEKKEQQQRQNRKITNQI